jgi:hypothetical protein
MPRPAPPPELTPEAREAAQEAILARWLALPPSWRNHLLERERARVGLDPPREPTYREGRKSTLTLHGQTRTIRQWAAVTGLDDRTIYKRRSRRLSVEKILGMVDLRVGNGRHARATNGQFQKAGSCDTDF